MAGKKEKVTTPKNEYELSINTPLLYLLQKITGDSTYKITSYFYDIMLKQRAEIEKRIASEKKSYGCFYQKKSYGYYPGTDAYCTTCTSRKEKCEYNLYGNRGPVNIVWECNVNLIRGVTKLKHEDLEKLMAEGILLGDAAGKQVDPPHIKKRGRKDEVEALSDDTDPNKEV
jgi:hypothetical protein